MYRMANAWITHVKAFQRHHGCTYKDALKRASASYTKLKGGNITKTAKDSGKRLITSGTDRAVLAIEGSGFYGGTDGENTVRTSTDGFSADKAKKALTMLSKGYGGKIGRVKKAGKWEQFVDSTLHDMIDTSNKARKTYQKGQRSEMTSGFGLKRHRKLSGKALHPAGYS
jgi:hypothetical protein